MASAILNISPELLREFLEVLDHAEVDIVRSAVSPTPGLLRLVVSGADVPDNFEGKDVSAVVFVDDQRIHRLSRFELK